MFPVINQPNDAMWRPTSQPQPSQPQHMYKQYHQNDISDSDAKRAAFTLGNIRYTAVDYGKPQSQPEQSVVEPAILEPKVEPVRKPKAKLKHKPKSKSQKSDNDEEPYYYYYYTGDRESDFDDYTDNEDKPKRVEEQVEQEEVQQEEGKSLFIMDSGQLLHAPPSPYGFV